MFIRTKKSGLYTYLQVVENHWQKGKVRQRVLGTLGRMDRLLDGKKLPQLLRSAAKFVDDSLIFSPDRQDQSLTIRAQRIGYAAIFEHLWKETGYKAVFQELSENLPVGFPVERAIYLTTLHRLTESGDICSPDQWRRNYSVSGIAKLNPSHLRAALVWMGEDAGRGLSLGNLMKDRIEENLFHLRRQVNEGLETVRVFATSLSLDAAKGAPDELAPAADLSPVRQPVALALAVDQAGCPVCSETWPLPVIDGPALLRVVRRLRGTFGARRICLICDQAAIGSAAEKTESFDEITVLSANGTPPASRGSRYLRLFPTIRHVFEAAAPLPVPPAENGIWPALAQGHLFCSYMALDLRKTLENRLEETGACFEWSDILHDLDRLIEVELKQDVKKLTLCTTANGICGKVFEAVGVPLPPSSDCLDDSGTLNSSTSYPTA